MRATRRTSRARATGLIAGVAALGLVAGCTGTGTDTGPEADAATPAVEGDQPTDGPVDAGGPEETATPPAPAGAEEVVASREVPHKGGVLRLDVHPVLRTGDLARATVTVSVVEMPATASAGWFFYDVFGVTGSTTAEDFQLLDLENQQRFLVARDEAGDCVCTTGINDVGLEEGGSFRIDATFAAPPDGVDAVDLVVPGPVGTVTGVPVR